MLAHDRTTMRTHVSALILSLFLLPQAPALPQPALAPAPEAPTVAGQVETVTIDAGDRTLRGLLFRPPGPGPFPAVLYNHGSAPGMLNNQAFYALAPLFTGEAGSSSADQHPS